MIAIDSNVLIRLTVRDDADQTLRAERLVANAIAQGKSIAVSTTVVVETVWAMRKPYKLPKSEIMNFIGNLIVNRSVELLDRNLIIEATDLYGGLHVDFADCVIGLQASDAGAAPTFSFDEDAIEHGLFFPVPA
jgi:predicted nucleic-acid-binding protein